MVSTAADALFRRLIDAFPPDRPYGRLDYTRDPMPASVARMLDWALEVHLDAAVPRHDPWFDFDHPQVVIAAREYSEELSRHQRVPANVWGEILREVCRSTTSYLIQPVRTMPDLVFGEGSDSAHPADVLVRLDRLPAYPYFGEVMKAYFDQKSIEAIDRDRFERLLLRIDRQMTGDYSAADWEKLLAPLTGLLSLLPDGKEGVPVDALRTFFEEKDAEAVVARLDARYTMKGRRYVRKQDLRGLFEPQAGDSDVDEPALANIGRMVESAHRSVQDDGPVPLWKQFERGGHAAEEPRSARSSSPPAHQGAAHAQQPGSEQPLWKQFRPEAETGSASGLADTAPVSPGRHTVPTGRAGDLSTLERIVLGERGSGNRDLFLRHLFGGSKDEYERTLRRLESASNWSEASQIIARDVFLKHQVNIYSDAAVAFTDAAEGQYGR